MSEMLMAIFMIYSTSSITSGKKSLSRAQNGGHFENIEILNRASIWPQIWKDPNYAKKYFHDDDVIDDITGWPQICPLYSFINEITTFFMITKKRAKISSLNFLCIGIMRFWQQLYKYIFMTSLMASPGNKIGEIFKLSIDQKLKMLEMLMAIFLVYSTFGITFGKKNLLQAQNCGHFENFEHSFNLTSDMKRLSQIMKKKCCGADVIDDITGWPQSFSLYSCFGEVGPGSKLKGQCLVNKCQYHNHFLGYTCQKTVSMNNTFSRLQVKGQDHRLTGWPWH